MFNKLKQFKDLRSKAKVIRNTLAKESIIVEKQGVKIVMNGNMEITEIVLNDELSKNSLEKLLTDCFNEAIRKTQRIMADLVQGINL